MKLRGLLGIALASTVGLSMAGCGGSMFRSAKTINDPLALSGRSAGVSVVLGGDALTRQFSAETPRPPSNPSEALLTYSFGNNINLAQYEGMETLSISQGVRLRFTFTPNTGMPGVITLRNVSLRLWLWLTDKDSQDVARSALPIELAYNGTLTIERQTDGSYLSQNVIPFSVRTDKADGWQLLNILASGTENTLTVDLSFTAETGSSNIPANAAARLSVDFETSSAYIQW
ncbi:MAG: hypothetical protein KatS3mg022_2835 [Armatimonadota bacterium]|nr:MAG: hypothetical protein KatS3mg022_2835 [Armatimonadota bacterium]